MENEKLKYGDRCLASDTKDFVESEDFHQPTIFLAKCEHSDGYLTLPPKTTLKDFESGSFEPYRWRYCRARPEAKHEPHTGMSIPFKNAIRKKTSKDMETSYIAEITSMGVIAVVGGKMQHIDYETLLEEWEWLNEDRTASPCGVKIESNISRQVKEA